MFNALHGNGTTVTEKLGLDSQVRELKFGSSFNPGNKGQQGSFHTIRYDFKPASVDKSKMASLEVGPNGQVAISMPHVDNTGSTVFKGNTRPYTKECVLIIDKDTGEVTLEKLTHNVQVKKTRQEGGSKNSSIKASVSSPNTMEGRSSSSIRNEQSTVPSVKEESSRRLPNASSSSSHQHLYPTNSSIGRHPNSPLSHGSSRHSPLPISTAGHNSPSVYDNGKQSSSGTTAFDAPITKQSSTMPSLTSLEELMTQTPPSHAALKPDQQGSNSSRPQGNKPHSKNAGELSESSSGDDSSSSSSSDEDDSSSVSDMEEVVVPIPPTETRRKETSSARPPQVTMSMPALNIDGSSSAISMPSHLLSEDLQLSESGSDSD